MWSAGPADHCAECRLLLALGNVDNSVWLLLREPSGSFKQVCRLKGHADWIRSLAFTRTLGNYSSCPSLMQVTL